MTDRAVRLVKPGAERQPLSGHQFAEEGADPQ